MISGRILVCFAVKEEARAFEQRLTPDGAVDILLTGMGRKNADQRIREKLAAQRPALVISSGFAGGCNPDWSRETVLFETEPGSVLERALLSVGLNRGRFLCADRVASTAAEKRRLWKETQADAIEMESEGICAICRRENIPCATVRIILDAADEDLPLDFNALLTESYRINYSKLVASLIRSPGKIIPLLHFQKATRTAAEKLAHILHRTLVALRQP